MVDFDIAGSHLYILPVGAELQVWKIGHLEEILDLGDVGSRNPDITLVGKQKDLILVHIGNTKQQALELGIPIIACYLGIYNHQAIWKAAA